MSHLNGITHIPTHVSVGRQFQFVADRLAHSSHQLDISSHTVGSILGTKAEALLQSRKPGFHPTACFFLELVEIFQCVETTHITRKSCLSPSTQQVNYWATLDLAVKVPECDIE